MLVFAPAKINIGLKVLGKRKDGYHNLDSIFYPIPLNDIIEFKASNTFSFRSTGLHVGDDIHNNLIYKAYELMRQRHEIGKLKIHLHKCIPMGAGLGGGSSDAAFTLMHINSLFSLGLSQRILANYAAELGADCPFFIYNKPMRAQGIGTIFEDVNLDLSASYIVLIKPNLHISTAEAYNGVKLEGVRKSLDLSVISQTGMWKEEFVNSFEHHLFKSYPILAELKHSLNQQGAFYASMSGSGSTIFGLFSTKPKLLDYWKSHFVWMKKL